MDPVAIQRSSPTELFGIFCGCCGSKLAATRDCAKNEPSFPLCQGCTRRSRGVESVSAIICRECHLGDREDLLILCDFCDLGCHMDCMEPKLETIPPESEPWMCPACKQAQLEVETILCGVCDRGDDEKDLLLCDMCGKGYHCFCLSPPLPSIPAGAWKCPQCTPAASPEKPFAAIQRAILADPKRDSTLSQFFGFEEAVVVRKRPAQRTLYDLQFTKTRKVAGGPVPSTPVRKKRPRTETSGGSSPASRPLKRRRCASSSSAGKKPAGLQLFKPTRTVSRRREQLCSLYAALVSKKMRFSLQPKHIFPSVPESMNDSKKSAKRVPPLLKAEALVYEQFVSLLSDGVHPPLTVHYDKGMGFCVTADEDLPQKMLLCEYVGEVDITSERECDGSNDSIMDLLDTGRPESSLNLCPKLFGNIAHLISGINNHTASGRKKINVLSGTFNIGGKNRVLLYTKTKVKKGTPLFYDYNAGGKNSYPTEGFC